MFKILIAEDDKNLRNLISINLKNQGYEVTAFDNGEDALDSFMANHYDLVVSDIMMPKKDGLQMAKEIREVKRETPIILLTALGGIEDKEKGYGLAIDDYLVKPVDMKELLLKIKAVLRRCK